MADKFHINGSGDPGKCSAKQGGCPFGGESDHYSTQEEAREQYEKANADKVIPLKPKQTLAELNKIAKTSTSQNELLQAVLSGSNRTLSNLSSNPSADSEALGAAHDKTSDKAIKDRLELHKNFPIGKLTEYGLQSIRKKSSNDLVKKMASDDVTDSQAQLVLDKYPMNTSQAIIKNTNNKVSQEMLIKLAEQNTTCLTTAILDNPKYPVKDRMASYNNDQLEAVAVFSSDIDSVKVALSSTINAHNRDRILYSALDNKVIPSDSLKNIANETSNEFNQLKVYSHPNSTREIKDILVKKNSTVASLNKLDELQKTKPEAFRKLENSTQILDRSGSTATAFAFDTEKVKELGLDANDIDAYVRIKQNNWLQHTKYDATTGIYSGHRD